MYKEVFYEEGIVKKVSEGIAVITLPESGECKECSIKLYCKPGNSKERSLSAHDPFGVKPGDSVRVAINGNKILSAAFMFYGMPLVILLATILTAMMIFETNKELFSSLTAIGMVALYGIIFSIILKRQNRNFPEIVFVRHP